MKHRATVVTTSAFALVIGIGGAAHAEGYWAARSSGGPSLAELFIGRPAWTQQADNLQVSVGPSWSRATAGAETLGLGAKLELGITDRWQLEVEGASAVVSGVPDASPERGMTVGTQVGLLRRAHLFVAAGAALTSTGTDASETEANLAGSASHQRWLVNLSAGGARCVEAEGSQLEATGAIALAFAAPVTPLIEVGFAAGDETTLRTSAGASTRLGSVELAAALGLASGSGSTAASVGLILSWDTEVSLAQQQPTRLAVAPKRQPTRMASR